MIRSALLIPLISGVLFSCGTTTAPSTVITEPLASTFTRLSAPIAPDVFLPEDQRMLDRINAARAAGATCADDTGTLTAFPPAGPVSLEGHLQRAAIRHAQDMVRRNYQAHVAPDPAPNGGTPIERIQNAGYAPVRGLRIAENLAFVQGTPVDADIDAIVRAWLLSSAGHCQALLDARSVDIGIWREAGTWATEYAAPL